MIHSGNCLGSLLILSYLWTTSYALNNAPVFLWGSVSIGDLRPALMTVTKDDFKDLLTPLLAEKSLVVFTEKEAFECSRLSSNKKPAPKSLCHQYLSNIANKEYLASVEKPFEVLHSLDENYSDKFTPLNRDDILKMPLEKFTPNKVFYVNLPQEESSTVQQDAVIASVMEYLNDKAFFMYTFSEDSKERVHLPRKPLQLHRERRQTTSDNKVPKKVFMEDGVMLSSLDIEFSGETKEKFSITNMGVKKFSTNTTVLDITLTTSNSKSITFSIIREDGYFFMYNLKYGDITFTTEEIYAPVGFSYFCGNSTFSGKDKNSKESKGTGVAYRLKWDSLQFQAFSPSEVKKDDFLDAWYCDGFFTPGILMSLLIIIFLMGVTFTGIAWLMDIKTMDRFDDPKGKTITINTSE